MDALLSTLSQWDLGELLVGQSEDARRNADMTWQFMGEAKPGVLDISAAMAKGVDFHNLRSLLLARITVEILPSIK